MDARSTLLMFVGLLGGAAPAVAQARLAVDSAAHEITISIGPIDLPPMDMSGHHHDSTGMSGMVLPPVAMVRVPVAVSLYAFSYDAVDARGALLSDGIVHHINFIDPAHRELFLPIAQRMLAVGKETGSQSLPQFLLGYPLAAGQPIIVSAMLDNETMASLKGITVRVRLKYVPAGHSWPLFEVYPFQMDVSFPAGDKDFDLPPGITRKSYEGSPAISGRLMAIGGHTHSYAQRLFLEDVTAGTVVWEGKPVLDASGNVDHVPVGRLYRSGGTRIYANHRYRVTVVYDNPTHDTIPDGGMGVVAGLFMPSSGVAWPAVDSTNPLYMLDRRHYLREIHGDYAAIMADSTRRSAPAPAGPPHTSRAQR